MLKSKEKVALGIVLLQIFGTSVRAAELSDSEVKDRLNIGLTNIEETARKERRVGGGVLMGVGALLGAGAIATGNSSDPETRSSGPVVLGITGGLFVLGGALVLALPTDYEELPQRYREIPEGNSEQLKTKVMTGEGYMERLANRAHKQRIWGGGTLAALGAADLLWYAASGDKSSSRSYLVYNGAFFVGIGIVSLLVEKEAESEYREYKEWKAGKGKLISSMNWGIAPVKDGGAFALALHF